MDVCKDCGKALSGDEIGLHKKMVNRGATEYYCMDCLSRFTGLKVETLQKKIVQFRAMGCTLFVPLPEDLRQLQGQGKV